MITPKKISLIIIFISIILGLLIVEVGSYIYVKNFSETYLTKWEFRKKKPPPFHGRRGSAGGEQLRRQRLRTDEVARILTCGASSCGRVRRPQREVKPEGPLCVAGVCGVA